MRRRSRLAAWAVLGPLCLVYSGDSEAVLFRVRRGQPCQGGACRPVTVAPAAPRASPPQTHGGGFLNRLNAYRASCGVGPAVWDDRLAAAAATTTGMHSPGSSGGGYSCWSPLASLEGSLDLWLASPAHRQLLLHGTRVGAGTGVGGSTANLL